MSKQDLEKRAKELGVKYTKDTTEEMLAILVENAELKAQNQEINQELASKETQLASSSKLPVIQVGKESYQVTTKRFMHKRKIYTAEELVENKELQKKLLKAGSEVLLSPKVIKEREAKRKERVKRTAAFLTATQKEA
jgi:uncharacterized protein YdbL (DUF1318 family)